MKALDTLLIVSALVGVLGDNPYNNTPAIKQQEEEPPKDPKYKKKRTRRANNHKGVKK